MARIAVAVSGGADSLFALYSLHEQGHDVLALHGHFLPSPNHENTQYLQELCERMHIPLHVLDLRENFDSLIVQPFIKAYTEGLTPNPCALCNAHMKFGLLLDASTKLGADFFATGHYATKNNSPCLSPLSKGCDPTKEQSYFLSLVPRDNFEKIIFPLANTNKLNNIKYLNSKDFEISLNSESQEICFVPEDAYRPFLEQEATKRGIALPPQGPILIKEGNTTKQIGEHKGLWQYTEGQRRGLGIAWSEPLYVCTKDIEQNALILGIAKDLTLNGCIINNINLFTQPEKWPQGILVRLRYRQQEAPAKVTWEGQNLRIELHKSQSPTACGQIATIYDQSGHVLAGGIIKEVF